VFLRTQSKPHACAIGNRNTRKIHANIASTARSICGRVCPRVPVQSFDFSAAIHLSAMTDVSRCEMLVHIDMKGAPPPCGFLVQLLPTLASWGASGLLMEWEDMLPFEGPLSCVSHPEAYTASEVSMFAHDCAYTSASSARLGRAYRLDGSATTADCVFSALGIARIPPLTMF
jgi:hypothetical protein